MTSRRKREGIDLPEICPQPVPGLEFHLLKSAIEKRIQTQDIWKIVITTPHTVEASSCQRGRWERDRHERADFPISSHHFSHQPCKAWKAWKVGEEHR